MFFENKKWTNQVLLIKYSLKYKLKGKSYLSEKTQHFFLINVKNYRLLHFEAYK